MSSMQRRPYRKWPEVSISRGRCRVHVLLLLSLAALVLGVLSQQGLGFVFCETRASLLGPRGAASRRLQGFLFATRGTTKSSAKQVVEEEEEEENEEEELEEEEEEEEGPPTSSRGGLMPLTASQKVPPVPSPIVKPATSKKFYIAPGTQYAKELRLLQHVVKTARKGDPEASAQAIENFGGEVLVRGRARLWLKVAGGEKTDVLTAAVKGAPFCGSVLEIGAYCGYSSTRMAIALPGVHVCTLDVDPVHVIIARNVHQHAGLNDRVHVWTGHSKDMLTRILNRYGGKCGKENGQLFFSAVFMDQKGSRYEEDMTTMEREGILWPGAVIVADNVLKPGAPLFLYKICNGGNYETQLLAMDEFAMPSEDWMSVCVKKQEPEVEEPEAPEDMKQLSREADRIRDRATGPGRSVSYEEWSDFAKDAKARMGKANILVTAETPGFTGGAGPNKKYKK